MRIKLLAAALFQGVAESSSLLANVRATFGNSPAPFAIDVEPRFIDDIRNRVSHTRAPIPIEGLDPAGSDGPTLANFTSIRDYWIDEYDWYATQASINSRLKQFTTTVRSNDSDYTHPVPLHFVHHQSPREDAIPFLFIHGWPGSFLEVENIIERLTNPPNSSVPAFHVVAPSIPGFGFSPAPTHAGYGLTQAGHSFHALMQQLGYSKYVIQGGDIGGYILRHQANSYPNNVVSVLSNFWLIAPTDEDLARHTANKTTPGEAAYLETLNTYLIDRSGYRHIQQTQPLTLAYLASDSPLGYALWIYALMRDVIDPRTSVWTPAEIITWSLMYTIQGPYGGFRIYKEMYREGEFQGAGLGHSPFVTQPVGVSQAPYDLGVGLPLDWARRQGNVKALYPHAFGGHFAAYKDTDALAGDIYRWFGDRELSGTAVFS